MSVIFGTYCFYSCFYIVCLYKFVPWLLPTIME